MNKREEQEASRLKEVISILVKHDLIKGLEPLKVRLVIEDLGPTFVKLGQIMSMRSDMLPKEYCEELEKLQSEVKPMDYKEVKAVIEESLGSSISSLFACFDKEPLGSASIAQVHKARLHSGEWIVVKVQRKGVREVMSRDIKLLKRASKILKIARGNDDVLDFETILDELWSTTQEELDFLMEASRLELFYDNNREVKYVSCPKVYRKYTSDKVLVMEYIDGIPINKKDELLESGYDLIEIGRKLGENYSKQVMEDGLFHADPHPGNIMVRDGEIVWLDLGMMGTLSKHGRGMLLKFTKAYLSKDINGIKEVILSIGIRKKKINHSLLYADIDDILSRYGTMDFAGVDIAKLLEEVLEVAKRHYIQVPSSYSMLGRGLSNIEGVLEMIAPDISYLEIAGAHMREGFLEDFDLMKNLQSIAIGLGSTWTHVTETPGLVNNILSTVLKGQAKVGMELQSTKEFEGFVTKLVNNIVIGLIIAALLIGSSLIATTDMKPQLLDIPLLGAIGYIAAAVLSFWLIIDLRKSKQK